jgi:hypothetical protein
LKAVAGTLPVVDEGLKNVILEAYAATSRANRAVDPIF